MSERRPHEWQMHGDVEANGRSVQGERGRRAVGVLPPWRRVQIRDIALQDAARSLLEASAHEDGRAVSTGAHRSRTARYAGGSGAPGRPTRGRDGTGGYGRERASMGSLAESMAGLPNGSTRQAHGSRGADQRPDYRRRLRLRSVGRGSLVGRSALKDRGERAAAYDADAADAQCRSGDDAAGCGGRFGQEARQ